jgi:hypothetical protein
MLSVNFLEHDGSVSILRACETGVRFFLSLGYEEAVPWAPAFGFLPLAKSQIFLRMGKRRLHRPYIQNEMANIAFSHHINKLEKTKSYVTLSQ